MLFKSHVPLFHRVTAFFAILCTIKPLINWRYGLQFDSLFLFVAGFLWLLVWHQWDQRQQSALRSEPISTSRVERYLTAFGQAQYDAAPVVVKITCWIIIVAVSFAIYFSMRR